MAKRRLARINEQLKREISDILLYEVRDPRLAGAGVTAVETAADLFRARVFLAPGGEEADKAEALEGARAAAAFIRTELAKRIELRHVPELQFELDRSLDYALRIERILEEVLPEEPEEGGSER